MNYPFRSATFGGFNKQDVITFLDAQFQQAGAAQQKLQDELDAARQELAELHQERDELNHQLEKVRRELEADNRKRANASACLEQMEQERDAARMQFDQLIREREELRRQLEIAQPNAQAYVELKDRTAGVELDAHRRAQSILDEAECETQKIRHQVEQWFQQMEQEYTAICNQVKETACQAAGHLEKARGELEQFNELMNGQGNALEGIHSICVAADPDHVESPLPAKEE